MDLNHERSGLNKRQNESHLEYIDRISRSKFGESSHDHAVPEMVPEVIMQRNALMKTHENTFYFSISSGERKQRFLKNREYFKEPEKLTKVALGFDSNVIRNLRLLGSTKKIYE